MYFFPHYCMINRIYTLRYTKEENHVRAYSTMNPAADLCRVFLCLSAVFFTQSSAGPFESSSTSVASINTSEVRLFNQVQIADHHTDAIDIFRRSPPSATPSPVPTEIPKQRKVSPEAAKGVWTPTAATGCLWLTEPPIPDGLPTQMVIDIISIRTESCRPAGSTLGKKRYYHGSKTESCRPEPSP